MRIAVDQRLKAEPRRILRPEKEAAVVEADAIHGRDVRREVVGGIDKNHVVEPAGGVIAELLVLLLPARVLGALPTAADDRKPAVGRPAGELRPGIRLAS